MSRLFAITSHADYCMPRHKPITKGSVCVGVCAHPKHMAEYFKVGERVWLCYACLANLDLLKEKICRDAFNSLQLISEQSP